MDVNDDDALSDGGDEAKQMRDECLPETIEATVSLLSRLQSVTTRAQDASAASPAASAATAAWASAAAWAVENDARGGVGVGSSTQGDDGKGSDCDDPGDGDGDNDDGDDLANTFVGSTGRARKWDWVRCCHAPVIPSMAAAAAAAGASGSKGKGDGRGGAGSGGQPPIAPVAIDTGFCHRTLRPGRSGPEGCSLEQV